MDVESVAMCQSRDEGVGSGAVLLTGGLAKGIAVGEELFFEQHDYKASQEV